MTASGEAKAPDTQVEDAQIEGWRDSLRPKWSALKLAVSSGILIWIFYATTAEMIWMFVRAPLPTSPVTALEPFRIANQYGLFAVMTRGRYEIEFQGSQDGQNWAAYPFPLQAAGFEQAAWDLRAVSAALRLEFVVRVPGFLARVSDRAEHRGAAAFQ